MGINVHYIAILNVNVNLIQRNFLSKPQNFLMVGQTVGSSGLMYYLSGVQCTAGHCRLQLLLQSNLFLSTQAGSCCRSRSELITGNIQLFWLSCCDCLINIISLQLHVRYLDFVPGLRSAGPVWDVRQCLEAEGIELECTHAVCTQYMPGQTVTAWDWAEGRLAAQYLSIVVNMKATLAGALDITQTGPRKPPRPFSGFLSAKTYQYFNTSQRWSIK